ncbi:hypothetical protein B0J14DRAFT_652283 [Halenospora varia]|nr:hypothetical protein B0J14DRAFT_652283 [Halenospora varia]
MERTIPDIPKAINPYTEDFGAQGYPDHVADLVFALDQGIIQLGYAIFDADLDVEHLGWKAALSPFGPSTWSRYVICRILIGIDSKLLRVAITRKLHQCFEVGNTIPLPFPEASGKRSMNQPVIYALVHCSSNGTTPSKAQYLKVLDDMSAYANVHIGKSKFWRDADALAARIDSVQPTLAGRRWATLTVGGLHPRRYGEHSHASRMEIERFVQTFGAQLSCISDGDQDAPIPWSLTYVGWSAKFWDRKHAHETHGGKSSAVAYLLEAAFMQLYPSDVVLRAIPLANIVEPIDAVYAEHILSIVNSSYTLYGGLNGQLGGDPTMQTNTDKLHAQLWQEGMEALELQKVTPAGIKAINTLLRDARMLKRARKSGADIDEIEGRLRQVDGAAISIFAEMKVAGGNLAANWREEERLHDEVQEEKVKVAALDDILAQLDEF